MKPAILLSFDIEEFDLPEEFGAQVSNQEKNAVSAAGTAEILNVFDQFPNCHATFFTTGVFAENNPDLIQRMVAGGHEIASHGYSHSAFVTEDLVKSRTILRKLSGQDVMGFRMARLAKVDKQDILNAGFVYESSLNPVFLPGRYNNFFKPLRPFHESCGLLQIPVSALPFVRLPLFWLSFKNFPFHFYAACASASAAYSGFFNLYTHPWEYNRQAADPKWRIPAYITRHAGPKMAQRLIRLIQHLQKTGDFITFREFAASFEKSK